MCQAPTKAFGCGFMLFSLLVLRVRCTDDLPVLKLGNWIIERLEIALTIKYGARIWRLRGGLDPISFVIFLDCPDTWKWHRAFGGRTASLPGVDLQTGQFLLVSENPLQLKKKTTEKKNPTEKQLNLMCVCLCVCVIEIFTWGRKGGEREKPKCHSDTFS